MGLIQKIFGGNNEKKEEKTLPWIPLTSLAQLDLIKEQSSHKPQVIFKHSTRCGISSSVMRRFVEQYEVSQMQADLYYLDLLNYREVSNEVGYRFQVIHQSPQLIVVKDGGVSYHASHYDIDATKVLELV